jgi:transposase-like protein/Zn ribbon nucleic-acid-binding protein
LEIPDDFPKTLPEFEEQFGTNEQCRAFLEKLRWPDGFVCPKCMRKDAWWWNSRGLHECECGHQTSVTAGTIFHGSRKPLQLWFKAMFFVMSSKSGMAATTLMRLMGFSYQTAWTWLHKLRKAMVRPGRPKLSGRVEVDESYFGGVDLKGRGRRTSRPIVACAVERLAALTEPGAAPSRAPPTRLGRVRLQVIQNLARPTLTKFTCDNVELGSVVETDGLASYDLLDEAGFIRKKHVIGDPKNAPKKLPGVHRIFSLLKRWLFGTHQGAVSTKHLPAYLAEYEFRFNRRRSSSRAKLFHRLVEIAVAMPPTTYDTLVDEAVPE